MCHFVLAALPVDADVAALDAVAREHGRRLQPLHHPDLERQWGAQMRAYVTTPGHCDCGTVVGSRLRAGAPDWDAEARKLVRKGWSEAKAARAIAQRREQEAQPQPVDTLAQWIAFVETMRAQRRVAGFGLMLHPARGALDEPFSICGIRDVGPDGDLAEILASMEDDVFYRFAPEKPK